MAQRLSGMENLWPGRVTQVIDPHYFWMQLGSRESLSQFEKMQRNMQEFGRQNFKGVEDAESLDYGLVVLVDTGDNSTFRFKRGQVARVTSGNSVDIFYVDYGNTELTTVDKIMVNMPPVFKTWMPQAVRCSLAGVKPISKNWTSRGTRTFQTATSGVLLHTLVLRGEPGYCEVSLYPSDAEDAQSISHLLLEEEVAMPKDGDEVPEYVKDVTEFMATYMSKAYSGGKMKDMDNYSSQKQDPIMVETGSNLQVPAHSGSPGSSPPSNSASSDKYIPPGRKYKDRSPKSPGSQYEGSPPTRSSLGSSPGQAPARPALQTTPKSKEPVVDFFPFDNVSTYPPTPVSPVKSPGRSSISPGSQETSYFSRSPSKYDHSDHQGYRGNLGNGQHYRGRGSDAYYGESGDRKSYRNGPDRGYRKQEHHHDRHRFAANFDNLPSVNDDSPPVAKTAAAAYLEPHYLNQMSERNGHSAAGEPYSNNTKYGSPDNHSPARPVSKNNTSLPFYPPKPDPNMQAMNLNTPQYYQAKGDHSLHYNKPMNELTPPGYYQSHKEGSPSKQADQFARPAENSPAFTGNYTYSLDPSSNQTSVYRSNGPNLEYRYSNNRNENAPIGSNRYFSQDNETAGYYAEDYDDPSFAGAYHHPNPPYKEEKEERSRNEGNTGPKTRPPRPHVHIAPSPVIQTPTKYQTRDHHKVSPQSPESPGIAAFNLNDLEHTQFSSAEMFNQRLYQERLHALQEEAEDIATESQEQSQLAQIARYGSGGMADAEQIDAYHPVNHEAFHQISEDLTFAAREIEELRNSPIKRTQELGFDDRADKLQGMPANYIADIDFTEAVREALEFAKTDGVENARALLDSVVESLRDAGVEKQLYDVLSMMLSHAVHDYEICQGIVMDTLSKLNNEMEIKECLAKALRRQQELCVQVPTRKNPLHQNFSRVMGAVYNMAKHWSDSNATIQDGILVTVEKWVLFNNKGSQIGQTDKENVFLDCFVAFWEVAGPQLIAHNDGFRSRLQEEIKQKLLNEKVSRSIRERLLDILLDLFLESNRASITTEESFTQTPRKTMIPSSCQVKPSVRQIGTMTDAEWDDLMSYNPDDTKWYSAVELNTTPDVSVSLRPQGQRSKDKHLSSTPDDMLQSSRQKTISAIGSPLNCSQVHEESQYSNVSDSLYTTPNSYSVNTSKIGLNENESASSANNNAVSVSVWPVKNEEIQVKESVIKSSNSSSLRTQQRSKSKGPTICETKSSSGKSIVDWFDYQPETENNDSKSPTAGSKSVEKGNLKIVDKSKDELSLSSIEEKYSVITKDKGSSNSAKSRKKEKSAAKSGTKSSPTSDKTLSRDASVSPAKDTHLSGSAIVVKGRSDKIGALVQNGRETGVQSSGMSDDSVRDWWGADDDLDTKIIPTRPPKHGACDIHIDRSPDVIIEDEFVESFSAGETEDFTAVCEDDNEQFVVANDTQENTPHTDSALETVQSDTQWENSRLSNEVTVESFGNGEVDNDTSVTAKDNDLNVFGFEGDLSDCSDEIEGFAFDQLNNDVDFIEGIIPAGSETADSAMGVDEENTEYNRNFPKANLADFIKSTVDDSSEPPSPSRWVPKKQVCFHCHDEGHKTEHCPKGIFILQ